MEKNSKRRITIIIFQAIILASVLFYGINICLPLPAPKAGGITLDFIRPLIVLIVSYAILIYILVRLCFKNVKKWEIVLYSILNVFLVIMIYVMFFELTIALQDMFQNSNPYDRTTEWQKYVDFNEEYEYIALPAGFLLFIFGVPNAIVASIFGIISMVFAFIKPKPKLIGVHAVEDNETKEQIKGGENKNEKDAIRYCVYCGKKVEKGAQFCKYCGKEIK